LETKKKDAVLAVGHVQAAYDFVAPVALISSNPRGRCIALNMVVVVRTGCLAVCCDFFEVYGTFIFPFRYAVASSGQFSTDSSAYQSPSLDVATWVSSAQVATMQQPPPVLARYFKTIITDHGKNDTHTYPTTGPPIYTSIASGSP